jgi:hypothetical protein
MISDVRKQLTLDHACDRVSLREREGCLRLAGDSLSSRES